MKSHKMFKEFCCFFVMFLVLVSGGYGQDLDTSKLDQLFDTLEKEDQAMGSIVVSKNGSIIYSRAIGYRFISDEQKIPADTDTNYRIWSITKTYTATMMLQLVEERKLSLSTTLDQFFPEIPNSDIITIKEMMGHKSGIHDFTQDQSGAPSAIEGNSKDIIAKNIARFKPDFKPGEKFEYSNSNYLLLGYIIENLDGVDYSTALSNRISSKIGLKSTHFGPGSLDAVANKSYSYQFDKKWTDVDEGEFSGPIPAGAGGIVSVPSDMTKFIEALFAGKLISKESLAEMTATENGAGLGIFKMSFDERPGFGHTGGYIASQSSLAYYPDDDLAVAYCTNGIVYSVGRLLEHVLKIYHNEPFQMMIFKPVPIESEKLNKYLGFYSSEENPMKIKMEKGENALVAKVEGLGEFKLNYAGNDIFFDEDVVVEFNPEEGAFKLKRGEEEFKFTKNQ